MIWRLSVKKLKKDNAKRPNISFIAICHFLYNLRSHVKRCSTNRFVDLALVAQLLREPEVGDLDLEGSVVEIDCPEPFLALELVHCQQLLRVVREMHHDVLKFEVPMYHQHLHHIKHSVDQHVHDFLHNFRADIPLSQLHQFFQV